jgi:hypothetical protein
MNDHYVETTFDCVDYGQVFIIKGNAIKLIRFSHTDLPDDTQVWLVLSQDEWKERLHEHK